MNSHPHALLKTCLYMPFSGTLALPGLLTGQDQAESVACTVVVPGDRKDRTRSDHSYFLVYCNKQCAEVLGERLEVKGYGSLGMEVHRHQSRPIFTSSFYLGGNIAEAPWVPWVRQGQTSRPASTSR